jgi:hypothetical protein
MHDLRLVGVHEDGEHLLLSDAEGGRFLLAVDDALRAAVRRDRPHLGQLQIEIGGGLRPREVQARIRAGASADEVAALAGWPVEKVRRYEGPVLAEREHVAGLAREVRLRRRTGTVTLGAEVTRRLTARGVDPDRVTWDSWRVEGDPWTVVVTFPAGGRERTARWHLDVATRSVTPGDDEARWLSEDQPEGEGPLAGTRLAAVPLAPAAVPRAGGAVYDLEVDGGLNGPDSSSGSPAPALDLVGAMRARRQTGRGRRRDTRPETTADSRDDLRLESPTHPAGRRRPRAGAAQPEPLELDPSLMDDPPAAHPPVGRVSTDGASTSSVSVGHVMAGEVSGGDVEAGEVDDGSGDVEAPPQVPADPAVSPSATRSVPGHWPLAEAMRSAPAPALLREASGPAAPDVTTESVVDSTAGSTTDAAADATADATPQDKPTGQHRRPPARDGAPGRAGAARRTKRSSVPSWDDIMFGTRQD